MPEDRRLAAIMFTDIVGYSALMGSDEDKAFRILRKNRKIQQQTIKKYRGEFIKEVGDGILASFRTSTDAVRCAGEIQAASKIEGIDLRIGIHESEVVYERGDILGDGVNVAARLEELAEKGSINISEAVYKNVRNKSGITSEFLEEKYLKNLDDPVKLYRVQCGDTITEKIDLSDMERSTKTNTKISYYVLAVLIIVILALASVWYFSEDTELAELDKSIAVLPFDLLSEDQSKRYQADGVLNSIISNLNKISELRVITKSSTEKYRNNPIDPRKIGKELNVSYILEGSFQMIGDDVRLSIGLINTSDGSSVWFEEYDRKWEDIFKLQSEIAEKIANEIKVYITPEIKRNMEISSPSDITAYEYYLRGEEYRNRSFEEHNYRYSSNMFEKAVEIDPEFTLAWLGLAATSRYIYWFHYDRSDEQLTKTKKYLDKAISLSPETKEVQLERALFHYHCRLEYSEALEILEKLKTDYPNDDELYFWISTVYRRMGEFKRSFGYTDQAIFLNPSEWSYWQSGGLTLRYLRNYDNAENYYKKVIDLNPSIFEPYWFLINLYSITGEIQKAKQLLKENPEFLDHSAIILQRGYLELYERNFEEAIRITETLSDEPINQTNYFGTKHLQLGLIYFIMSDQDHAVEHFEIERDFLEEKLQELKKDSRIYSSLGITYAGLGMKEKAIEMGNKAVDIHNLKNDALDGFHSELDLARILLMTGEYETALSKLKYLLERNGDISIKQLQLDPFWDPVKDTEEFKAILSDPFYQIEVTVDSLM